MNRKISFGTGLLLILLVIITGCSSGDGKSTTYNFKQGIAEPTVEFVRNAPPDKIYPLSNFKIIAQVHNQAAYDVQDVTLQLVGLVASYFDVVPTVQSVNPLLGRSAMSPDGDSAYVEFDGRSGQLFQNAEYYTGNFATELSYRSGMEFADTICINPSLYEVYDSGCTVQPKKSYSGQGAPLAVTAMEEVVYPGTGAEIEFRFTMQNRGQGTVGTVMLKSATLGGEALDCFFQGTGLERNRIEFKDQRSPVTLLCRKSYLRDLNSYMTSLTAQFEYNYTLLEKRTLTLVK
ncbi:TPA: hypothetical protein HA241_01995 [Candidatus Woesearchaeota archaeon]|nr:hypothetical protein [Candidatus Woesearchaeota archaeon]